MSISLELVVQLLTVIVTGGGVLWKVGDRLKSIELDQQANAARIEGSVRAVESEMRQGFGRADERMAALTARVEAHEESQKIQRESISKVHGRVDRVRERVIHLEAVKKE